MRRVLLTVKRIRMPPNAQRLRKRLTRKQTIVELREQPLDLQITFSVA